MRFRIDGIEVMSHVFSGSKQVIRHQERMSYLLTSWVTNYLSNLGFLDMFIRDDIDRELHSLERLELACEQALCLGKKIARKGKGKEGREPVDKHLRPLFRPLVIILPNICQ